MNKYLLTATVLLSGCAPLQQAPLVYTSKQVLGIDISAPTTESAGISLNVGFKNIDAAYVPVAVSKETEDKVHWEVTPIFAVSGEGKKNNQSKSIVEPKEIEKLTLKADTKEKEIEILDTAKAQILQKNPINKKEPLLGNKNIFKELTQLISLPPGTETMLKANKTLPPEETDSLVKKIENTSATAKAELSDVRKEMAKAFDKIKTDAMSVFGSFDSRVKGDNSAGVLHNMGKIFSTGVAAQNLTEGLQKYAILEQCLELIKNTTDMAQKTALIGMCTNPVAQAD